MTAGTIAIGEWVLDGAHNELRRGAESIRLEPKVIEVLAVLARSAGTAVSREELLSTVWPGVIVGDDALTQAIIKLRKALGDDAHHPRYIETISKRGYRLIAPVAGMEPAHRQAAVVAARGRRKTVLAAGALVTLVIAIAAGMSTWKPALWPIAADTKGAAAAGLPTVAVLPLANLSGDPGRDYLGDGITEDVIDALGRFSGLRVMSRNAVQPFKGKAVAPQAIRDELGARYVVQGSLRAADGRIRVAVELSDTEKGSLLWADK